MLPRVNLVRTDTVDYLLLATDDVISRTIHATGAWESPLLAVSRMFLDDVPAPFVLDIGANLGAYAIPLAREIAGRGGVVHAFEPQRIVYYQLCGNVFLNRLDNVYAYHMAVGDRDGTAQVPAIDYGRSRNIGGFSLDRSVRDILAPVAELAGAPASEVPLQRIDSLSLPAAPALIKIDVEGMELQVLKGAVETLRRCAYPPLLLEAWNLDWFREQRQALLAFLDDLGYVCFSIMDEIIAQHPSHPRQIRFSANADGSVQMTRAS